MLSLFHDSGGSCPSSPPSPSLPFRNSPRPCGRRLIHAAFPVGSVCPADEIKPWQSARGWIGARWARRGACLGIVARAILPWLVLTGAARAAEPEVEAAKMLDRYLAPIAERQWTQRVTAMNAVQTPAEIEVRQKFIRERLLAQIGGLPEEKSPLRARVTGVVDGGDYTVEKVVFESLPRFYVTANVYVPKRSQPPFPAVLGAAGHSNSGKSMELYQRVWISLAKRGILVLAWDPLGQGERLQYPDASGEKTLFGGGGTGEHTMAGVQCLLTGAHIARYFVWDGMRALDYLLTRSDVDPKRIGVTGNSGGGTMTCYLAAFDQRLAAAAPSCYLTSWSALWPTRGPQDAEQVLVDFIADGLDFSDFVIAFAPKPLQMATATQDYFPIAGAKATFAEARRIYTALGAEAHLGFFEYNDTHGWSRPRREATVRWLSQWLLDRQDDGVEPAFDTASAEALRCTPTGQVATSYPDAETVQSLNAALARTMYVRRTAAAQPKDLAEIVRRRLGLVPARSAAAVAARGVTEQAGYRVEKFELTPEPGIVLPAAVFVPTNGSAKKSAVLYLDPAGAMTAGDVGGPIEALVREGNVVLAFDPRGYGRSAPRGRPVGGYSPEYSTAMRALLVGRNLPGMQTADVLSAFDFLAARPDVAAERIRLMGKNNAAVPALFAGLLERRITRVTVDGGPESFLALSQAATTRGLLEILVPGVLRDFDLPDVRAALGERFERVAKTSR